jgi:hypothetical protein
MTTHIELGHALLTMIEPARNDVAEYNSWYERDHFLSGVLTGPAAFAGRRYVATRKLKDLRFPAESPIARPADQGSFTTLYWIEDALLADHLSWGYPEAARLAGLGRMNPNRTHVSSDYFDLVNVSSRPSNRVPPELALHHPYPGLVVVWTGRAAAASAGASRALGDALVHGESEIGQVVSFAPTALPPSYPPMPGVAPLMESDKHVHVHCAFIDGDVAASWPALRSRIDAAVRSADVELLLAAPFIPTIPGTDAFLDELW